LAAFFYLGNFRYTRYSWAKVAADSALIRPFFSEISIFIDLVAEVAHAVSDMSKPVSVKFLLAFSPIARAGLKVQTPDQV
jgi:hypothetical protein